MKSLAQFCAVLQIGNLSSKIKYYFTKFGAEIVFSFVLFRIVTALALPEIITTKTSRSVDHFEFLVLFQTVGLVPAGCAVVKHGKDCPVFRFERRTI
jgi:hypothetical protein